MNSEAIATNHSTLSTILLLSKKHLPVPNICRTFAGYFNLPVATSAFRINILSLKNGSYLHTMEVNDAFFAAHPGSIVQRGNLTVKVQLEKSDAALTTMLDIAGWVELECGRSADFYQQPIHTQERIIFKFGDEDRELSEDVQMIRRTTTELDLAQFVYEFIHLALPVRRIKPELAAQEDEDANQEGTLVYTSATADDDEELVPDSNRADDPKWQQLKKLFDN